VRGNKENPEAQALTDSADLIKTAAAKVEAMAAAVNGRVEALEAKAQAQPLDANTLELRRRAFRSAQVYVNQAWLANGGAAYNTSNRVRDELRVARFLTTGEYVEPMVELTGQAQQSQHHK
jgi:hypothetical protein